jgi:hypothetical protein
VAIDPERSTVLSNKHQENPIYAIVPKETIQLTNWMIRTTWKICAAVTAISIRLLTSIVLAVARRVRRNRINW